MRGNFKRVKALSLILVTVMLWHFAGGTVYAQTRPLKKQQEAVRVAATLIN